MAPVTLKAIDLLKGSWTCPADAPSTGKRCCNPIGQRRRVDLEKLFGGLSVEYSSTILTRAAQQAICNRHQSQAANVSKTWTRLIQASPNHASARTCVAPGYQQSFAQAPRIKHEVPEHPDLKDLEIERLSRQVRDYMAECQAIFKHKDDELEDAVVVIGQLQEQVCQHNNDIKDLKNTYGREIRQRDTQHGKQIRDLEAAHKKRIREDAKQVEALKEAHQEEINVKDAEQDDEVKRLGKEKKKLQEENHRLHLWIKGYQARESGRGGPSTRKCSVTYTVPEDEDEERL